MKKRGIAILLLCLCGHNVMALPAKMYFVTEYFPPFVMGDTTQASGPCVEVVLSACHKLKISCSISLLPWRRSLVMLANGEANGVFILLPTPEREEAMYLSPPIVHTAYGLYQSSADNYHYERPLDLNDFTIGVYGPSGSSSFAEKMLMGLSNTRLEIEVDNLTVLKKLSSRRYGDKGVALINMDVASYLVHKEKIAGIRLLTKIKNIQYVIGLSKKNVSPADAQQFMNTLQEMLNTGEIKHILAAGAIPLS